MNQKKLLSWLFLGFVVSVLLVLSINFWWVDIPEIWSYGSELGELATSFLLAYISGFLFYYLISYQQEKQTKRNVNKLILGPSQSIVFSIATIFNNVGRWINVPSSQIEFKQDNFSVFKEFSKLVDWNKISYSSDGITGEGIKWIDLILKDFDNIDSSIEKVRLFGPFLDDYLIELLSKISSNGLVNFVEIGKLKPSVLVYNGKSINLPFDGFLDGHIDELWSLMTLAKSLEKYIDSNLKS